MTEIHIDHRENALHPFEDIWNITPIRKNLLVGDIQFWKNSKMVLCVERKTYADLADSIKSGRYREQRYRLLQSYEGKNICYLFEGTQPPINGIIHGLTWKTIMGVIINLQYRDNIKVLYSQDPKTTVYLLNMIYQKIEGDKIYGKRGDNIQNIEYTHNVGISKKSNLTPETCYKLQLVQIPGISHGIVDKISDKYPNLECLINLYKKDGDTALANLVVGNGSVNRKASCLGKKRSSVIFRFLGLEN